MMTFDDITNDGRLWAVRFEGENENALYKCFARWNNVEWLRGFFIENSYDLESYFKITDVNNAIYDTIEDADKLWKRCFHHNRRSHQTYSKNV